MTLLSKFDIIKSNNRLYNLLFDCHIKKGEKMVKKAFTLSEVLITLGIIGVVAALTLPSVIKNYQKQLTVNRLKESYGILLQAFHFAISEHGTPNNWTYDNNNLDLFVDEYFAPYMKIINKTSDIPKHYYKRGGEFKYVKNSKLYYLANGTAFVVYIISGYQTTHYFIDVDINGVKGPNKYGRDIFRMQFNKVSTSEGLLFNGINNSVSDMKSGCKDTGSYCGAWIVKDGWKISDDYPW